MRSLREATLSVHPALTAANLRPMTDVVAQVAEPRFNMAKGLVLGDRRDRRINLVSFEPVAPTCQ